MAKYEIDLCRRRLLKDGVEMFNLPKEFGPDDEVYEIHHIDEVQLAAIEESPVSIESSDLKKVTFRVDPLDRMAQLKRTIQSCGAYAAKFANENGIPSEAVEMPLVGS